MGQVLNLNQVNKVFNPVSINENHVINNIDFHVDDGDFITVIGSNGAGKSTLLNLIAGTIFPSSGRIDLGGRDVTNTPAYERAKYIGRVFQDPQMGTARNLSIEENLGIAFLRGESRGLGKSVNNDMREVFKEKLSHLGLGLENRLKTPASALSGGQRQVLTLLMAVLKTPKLLLLDEHTAALDPKTSDMVMELTENLILENRLTSLMITHNMEEALKYGNRLIMLHGGRVAVDVRGEEKEKLEVGDLLNLFHQNVGENITSDSLLL